MHIQGHITEWHKHKTSLAKKRQKVRTHMQIGTRHKTAPAQNGIMSKRHTEQNGKLHKTEHGAKRHTVY